MGVVPGGVVDGVVGSGVVVIEGVETFSRLWLSAGEPEPLSDVLFCPTAELLELLLAMLPGRNATHRNAQTGAESMARDRLRQASFRRPAPCTLFLLHVSVPTLARTLRLRTSRVLASAILPKFALLSGDEATSQQATQLHPDSQIVRANADGAPAESC